jgi:serine/threonine-protein kinase
VEPTVPAYVSEVLTYGLQLRPVERIQTVPQLMDALASQEQAAALLQSRREADPQKDAEKGEKRGISLKSMLAAIILLLAVLLLLMLWGLMRLEGDNSSAASEEPASVSESEAESAPVNYVPNFEGLTYAQVQNNRQYTSDYLFRVTEEYSDTAAAGIIIQQEPEAGAVLEDGETIRLVVSKGPQLVEMPSIIGFTQEGAIKELESRGLVPSCFMVVNDGSYASGCVVRCSTDAGTQLEVGSIVTVYIAAERDVQVTVTPEPDPEATETPDDTAEPLPPDGEEALPTDDVDMD